MTFPGKVMADSETQKLERKDFFQSFLEENHKQVLNLLVILSRSAESEEATACWSEG